MTKGIQRRYKSLIFGSVFVGTLSGCTAPVVQNSVLLEPATWDVNKQPEVVFVYDSSEHRQSVSTGDQLAAIGATAISSYEQLLPLLATPDIFDQVATIRRKDGSTVELPMEDAFRGKDGLTQIEWVEFGSTAQSAAFPNPDGEQQTTGGVYAGQLFVGLAARLWNTTPKLLELQVVATAMPQCAGCGLAGLGAIDVPRNSWVQPVPMEQAAWAVIPDLGAPGQAVAVPPPTPVGGTAFSSTTGTARINSYGNYATGTYSGNTTTTYTPQYDYAATNAAQMQNLGVAIRNARIENQNAARMNFASKRFGNLRLGTMNPNESMQGHVFFALPAGFDGPFAVQVVNTTGEFSWLRFSPPSADSDAPAPN